MAYMQLVGHRLSHMSKQIQGKNYANFNNFKSH